MARPGRRSGGGLGGEEEGGGRPARQRGPRPGGRPAARRGLPRLCAGSVGPGGALRINGEAVTVVYFRSGYTPTDFPTEREWEGRALLERSSAVKCPSLRHALPMFPPPPRRARPRALGRLRACSLHRKDDGSSCAACSRQEHRDAQLLQLQAQRQSLVDIREGVASAQHGLNVVVGQVAVGGERP